MTTATTSVQAGVTSIEITSMTSEEVTAMIAVTSVTSKVLTGVAVA
jgi:hypothetical protein